MKCHKHIFSKSYMKIYSDALFMFDSLTAKRSFFAITRVEAYVLQSINEQKWSPTCYLV